MKKLILISFCIVFYFSSFSQEKYSHKEIGVTFYNFDNYGMIFKVGQENKLWRFRLLDVKINRRDTKVDNFNILGSRQNIYSISFSAGREKRKAINEHLNFIYGIELTGGYSFREINNSSSCKSA